MTEKTIAQKLLIKPGQAVLLVNPPAEIKSLLSPLPDGARLVSSSDAAAANVVLLFANHREDLERLLPAQPAALAQGAIVWVAYHKGTSSVKTDINRDSIWNYAKTIGMDGISMISINEDWSAMRLKRISVEA